MCLARQKRASRGSAHDCSATPHCSSPQPAPSTCASNPFRQGGLGSTAEGRRAMRGPSGGAAGLELAQPVLDG